jgi:deoxycytidine triphosphate deaminase
MSVIGVNKLLNLVKKGNLVEGLSDRELNNPEGAGFDLRIGEIYEIEGKGFLGVEERETPKMRLIAKYEEGKRNKVGIKPNIYYTFKTLESVNMPDNLLALITPRSTLFRSGVFIFGGQVPPGYKGGLVMGMYNFRNTDFEIEMGSRAIHIMFFKVEGSSNLYRGQWQGGRVTTQKREKQV